MILFVDGTLREESRTLLLAKELLKDTKEEIKTIKLSDENILPLNKETLDKRNNLISESKFEDEMFDAYLESLIWKNVAIKLFLW